MSQVIDIFTIDSLQINETIFRASGSSPSIDDNHSTLSSSSYYLPKLPTLHPPRIYIGVLLTDFKKFYVYFMKMAMPPVHIVPVYYIHYLQNG